MSAQQRVVNTIPSQDAVLRRVVDHVTAEASPASADALAEQLRAMYPKVAVFERQLSGERSHLYVYRDGRYEPDHGESWWKGAGVARARVSRATGLLTSVTGPWASLMRSSEADLVGRPFTDFVSPAARTVARCCRSSSAQSGPTGRSRWPTARSTRRIPPTASAQGAWRSRSP